MMTENQPGAAPVAAPSAVCDRACHPGSAPLKTAGRIGLRRWVQLGFVVGSILTGVQFQRFIASLSDPAATALAPRPAAVDAWLPVSSLMSLVYLAKTGIANAVHPAGLVLFTLILISAVALRRGFCSWVCPIGTLCEVAHQAGQWLFKRNLRLPKPLDVALRAIKYLLLAFFIVVIVRMSAADLSAFIHGPYNRTADVKMYLLFAHLSRTALFVLAALGVLSVLFKNFWCRYLCPYGALLGLASIPSPVAVRREAGLCTGCGACTRACPNGIAVHARASVRSPECTACHGCVDVCPQPGALRLSLPRSKRALSPLLYGLITVAAFVLVSQAFRAFGYWDSDTPRELYRAFYANARNRPVER